VIAWRGTELDIGDGRRTFKMKAKLKLITVAMLGVGITGILLAGISAHAEMPTKAKSQITMRWDSEKPIKDLSGKGKK
jgi:hypothetical protein